MKTYSYNVIFDYPMNYGHLHDFTVIASSLKEAKQRAQFSKRMYCRYDAPSWVKANRVKTIVKRIWK